MTPDRPARPSPYKGLRHYTYVDAPLFAGRESEVTDCLERLLNSDVSLFVLHGHSGSGKSSFLHAALLPSLEAAPAGAGRGSSLELLHAGVATDPLILRAGKQPLHRLAETLFAVVDAWMVRHPAGKPRLQRALLGHTTAAAFAADAGRNGVRMFDAFAALSLAFQAKPFLLLDQAEDVFAAYEPEGQDQDEDRRTARSEFFTFLAMLIASPIDLKLLVSLRTEFKPRFDEELASRRAESTQYASYMLKGMSKAGMQAAVLRPTAPHLDRHGQPREYNFSYDADVPGLIVDDLWSNTEPSSRLPVLQVICDRLFAHRARAAVGREAHFRIEKEHYWANGLPSAQVSSYLEEAITRSVCNLGTSPPADVSAHVDRWHRALSALCETLPDGLARTRTEVRDDELRQRAIDVGCDHVGEVLAALQDDQTYVLKSDRASGGSAKTLLLVHDTLAMALARWTMEHNAAATAARDTELEPVVVGARLRIDDLYDADARPASWMCETINDLIWDHQILLYAEYRGFSGRLGIQFRVPPGLDISDSDSDGVAGTVLNYTELLDRQRGDLPRTLVLPSQVYPRLRQAPWTRLGVANLYRGYAIVGPKRHDVKPISGDETPAENTARLMKLAAVLSNPATKVFAFEDQSRIFLNLIVRAMGRRVRNGHDADADVDSLERSVDVRDRMFAALVEGKAEFALGTAPSRALALQAGFVVYADFLGVHELWSRDPGMADELKQLNALNMHEDVAVDTALTEPTRMRLLSVVFYTIEHIRLRPDEFVAFLHDQQLRALSDGAYPIQRRFIRDALRTCYEYMALGDYAFDVLSPTAPRAHPHPAPSQRDAIRGYVGCRFRCDRLMARLMRADPARLDDPAVERQFAIARSHYRIMNYYDAAISLRRVWDAIGSPGASEG